MLKQFLTVGLVRIIVVFTKILISKVMSVSMETNPLKIKPYLCSMFSTSLKSLQYKVYPQWSFKKAISNWTSMPGCTIFFIFLFELRFKTYGRPYVIVPKFFISRKVRFSALQILSTTLHKSCVRINACCECNDGWSGDLRSGITRDYSKKLSSMETTHFDEENQAFLTADCGHLQVPFTSP